MRRGTLTPLASLISIPSSCDHARVLENSRRSKQISLSLFRRHKHKAKSIDRSIHRYIWRTNRNIGKGSGWKIGCQRVERIFPCVYTFFSLFLSPLAGFSLRFNDRLTESLCFFLFLSLSIEISRFISLLARFGKSGISIEIELVRSPSYLDEVERGWGRGGKAVSRKIARFAFPFFPPLLQNLYLSDFLPSSLVSPLLSSSTSPPFRRLARIVSDLSRVAKFHPSPSPLPPPSYRLIWPGSKPESTKPRFTE